MQNLEKNKGRSRSNPLWVKKETRDRIRELLGQANQKEKGRKIYTDALIAHCLKLIKDEDIATLQDQLLSFWERFDREYEEHNSKNGFMDRDDYIRMRFHLPPKT